MKVWERIGDMREVLIDTSEGHVGIVIAEGQIIKIFSRTLTKKFGKPVHMRELSLGQKVSALREFDELFYEKGYSSREIELHCLKAGGSRWWINLVGSLVQMEITSFNVDSEVQTALKRYVDNVRLKSLSVYTVKETLQLADIVAFGNSHHLLARNIWKNVPLKIGS